MFKTLLVLSAALLVSATGLHAQGRSFGGRGGGFAAHSPAFSSGSRSFNNRGFGGYGRGGYYGHRGGYYGRYYYLGGIPYFYPFGFGGFGYGYGGFYGDGFYGDGFYGGPYGYGGYGYGGYGYGGEGYGADGYAGTYNGTGSTYQGRVVNKRGSNGGDTNSLPAAVQRQLSKRGYYKGSVDGQFGAESRSALSRFQRKQGLKETGQIDEKTLEALGFTDRQ